MIKGRSQKGLNLQPGYQYFSYENCLRRLQQPFLRPQALQVMGDVRMGYVHGSSTIFGIYKQELGQHALVTGRSGSGKTTLLRLIQMELYRLGIPFLSFDLAKHGSRYLKKSMPDLIILRWNKEFFFNPLKPPPSVGLNEWSMAFTEITAEVFKLHPSSTLYLIEFIQNRLYTDFKIEEIGNYPTIHDLERKLEERKVQKAPRNEIGYIATICNKLKPICITLNKCVDVQDGIPIDELLKHPVCVELVGIKSSLVQVWPMSMILAWIVSYREANPSSEIGTLSHVLFYDEAAKILGKGDE
jgi:hypothetical protein